MLTLAVASGERAESFPRSRIAWTTVFVLFVFYVFAMIARQVMSVLVDPIKLDLGITDVQASYLIGLSFAIFFTTMGLPMGWLGDRFSRRAIIAVSVAIWGLASAACGLATNFGQLFAARVLVGIGEAALGPIAFSLLADSFRPNRLGLALSLYSTGGLIGGAAAVLGGGLIFRMTGDHGLIHLPLIGDVTSWRAVFLLTGLPGPLLALAMFVVPEPDRTGRINRRQSSTETSLLAFLRHNAALLFWLCAGYGALNMIVNNVVGWLPTMMHRSLGLNPVEIGLLVSLLLLTCAIPGQVVNGLWIDRQARKGRQDGYLRYYVMFLPIAAISGIIGLLSHSALLFALALAPLFFIVFPFMGSASTALQRITPNEFRGRVSAIFLTITMLLGIGLGPTLVALVSIRLDPSGHALGSALAILVGVAGLVGTICLAIARSRFIAAVASREDNSAG